jgi:hypothetical protein
MKKSFNTVYQQVKVATDLRNYANRHRSSVLRFLDLLGSETNSVKQVLFHGKRKVISLPMVAYLKDSETAYIGECFEKF